MFVYVEDQGRVLPADEIPEGTQALRLSGTELRRRLAERPRDPGWFTFPEVAEELRRRHPPAAQRGLHRVLHRTVRLRQVDRGERAADQAAGAWAAGR